MRKRARGSRWRAFLIYKDHTLSWSLERTDGQPVRDVAARVVAGAQLRARAVEAARAGAVEALRARMDGADEKAADELEKEIRRIEALTPEDAEKELFTPFERRMDLSRFESEIHYDELLPGVSAGYHLTDPVVKETVTLADEGALRAFSVRLYGDYDFAVTRENAVTVLYE